MPITILLFENILIIFVYKFIAMPRKRRPRKLVAPPAFKGYSPYGNQYNQLESVDLLYEEYEAIKLADYDLLNHKEAAKLMDISRPTFARIYESARRKIALAFVEVKEIKTVFGNACFDETWYICNDCHARFTIPAIPGKNKCPMCKSENMKHLKIK